MTSFWSSTSAEDLVERVDGLGESRSVALDDLQHALGKPVDVVGLHHLEDRRGPWNTWVMSKDGVVDSWPITVPGDRRPGTGLLLQIEVADTGEVE